MNISLKNFKKMHSSNEYPKRSKRPSNPTLKMTRDIKLYNSDFRKKPAELFRKDLISAMKMADSEQLNENDYITITDHWKEEWEKGVQVPVNPDSLPVASFTLLSSKKVSIKKEIETQTNSPQTPPSKPAKQMPRKSEYIKYSEHPNDRCRYELDLIDMSWQELMSNTCLPAISENLIEDVITELERQCSENMKNNKIGIEFNDGVVCDVCRSPYSEDGNEMVFCDVCNVCVHQACYDISNIPAGEWFCQPCRELGKVEKASCMLCPNKNGAMKKTPDDKWAHVSCSLWVVSQIDGDHKDTPNHIKTSKNHSKGFKSIKK